MSDKPARLDQIQRWMQSVIMHPGGVAEAISSPEARQHLEVDDLESVITRSRSLDSASRLEIYVDAYYERLMECLREEFAATLSALGQELFDALVFGYLREHPSRSYTLNQLGASFPKYLRESRLHERAAPQGAATTWGDFVVELTTFERLLRDVFDAPGSEGREALDGADLAAVPAQDWDRLRLLPVPCLRLQRFGHPVHEYWAAAKDGKQPSPPHPRPTCLAVNRRDYVVERHELSPPQFVLLQQLIEGQSLSRALADVIRSPEFGGSTLERNLGIWFAQWTSDRFFIAFERLASD